MFDQLQQMRVLDIFPLFQHLQIGRHLILNVESQDSQEELVAFLLLADPVLSRGDGLEQGVILADLLLLLCLRLTHARLYKKYSNQPEAWYTPSRLINQCFQSLLTSYQASLYFP
jgi:hypothetical protein